MMKLGVGVFALIAIISINAQTFVVYLKYVYAYVWVAASLWSSGKLRAPKTGVLGPSMPQIGQL
jgi:hypothetical protein